MCSKKIAFDSRSSPGTMVSVSRSSFGTRVQRSFHLLDKMLVATAFLVGRNERMWQISDSGRLLILSSTESFWRESLRRSAIKESRLCIVVVKG